MLRFHREKDHRDLRLIDVTRLHDQMQNYEDWVAAAPDQYTNDNFLTANLPILVTSRYGQNQPLGTNDEETASWFKRFRKFQNIRYVSVALATDIG
jgi:hypothetical protein